jgi:hypothetical protein
MRVAYLDCFAGISGDMTLGAFLDAGLNLDDFAQEIAKLNLHGYQITAEKVMKNGISGTQVKVEIGDQKVHRNLRDIVQIIERSTLDTEVKATSIKIFEKLASAEAKIHNTSVDKIHFHEVGAMDAIIDIVGAAIGIRLLGIEKVYASAIHVGQGFIDCRHGRLPGPAPATADLLKGIPVYSTGIDVELTTPTGAAIVSTLAVRFGGMPEFTLERIGYGAGQADLKLPNLLRVLVGEARVDTYERDTVSVIETNIDDMNPEYYGYVSDRLMLHGALDVSFASVFMKKNRLGVLVTVLCPNEIVDAAIDILLSETSTMGVRVHRVERKKLPRENICVKTEYGDVNVKLGKHKGKVTNVAPEFEDCKRIATERGIPLKDVFDAAKSSAKYLQ